MGVGQRETDGCGASRGGSLSAMAARSRKDCPATQASAKLPAQGIDRGLCQTHYRQKPLPPALCSNTDQPEVLEFVPTQTTEQTRLIS